MRMDEKCFSNLRFVDDTEAYFYANEHHKKYHRGYYLMKVANEAEDEHVKANVMAVENTAICVNKMHVENVEGDAYYTGNATPSRKRANRYNDDDDELELHPLGAFL